MGKAKSSFNDEKDTTLEREKLKNYLKISTI